MTGKFGQFSQQCFMLLSIYHPSQHLWHNREKYNLQDIQRNQDRCSSKSCGIPIFFLFNILIFVFYYSVGWFLFIQLFVISLFASQFERNMSHPSISRSSTSWNPVLFTKCAVSICFWFSAAKTSENHLQTDQILMPYRFSLKESCLNRV